MVTIFRLIPFLLPLSVFSWNAKGHMLITALALNKMPQNKQNALIALNNLSPYGGKPQSLIDASVWLDTFYLPQYRFLKKIHYIQIPFGQKKYFPTVQSRFNAVTALYYAQHVLQSRYHTPLDKTFALRLYLHIIADIHQPMHATTYYSKGFPHGDKGGNYYRMKIFHRQMNLHHFWDEAGGYLTTHSLEQAFLELKDKPCIRDDSIFQPEAWAKESHGIGMRYAYFPPRRQSLMPKYQRRVEVLSKVQIQRAACRMAAALTHLNIQGLNTVG